MNKPWQITLPRLFLACISHQRLKALEQNKPDKEASLADIGKFTSGLGTFMGVANAELEVVRTGGGNWAEHQWVKEQLRIAYVQRDLNDGVKHNYGLYQKYATELKNYGAESP